MSNIYPSMMKLETALPELDKILKLYETPDTPLDFC